MKFCRHLTLVVLILAITVAVLPTQNLTAKELPCQSMKLRNNSLHPMQVSPSQANIKCQLNYGKNNRIMADELEFTILDSLLNAFSYFSCEQQPFIYSRELNKLITIKRGFNETDPGDGNTKDNFFILTSDDWGKTWAAPELVYNSKKDAPKQMGRYPSVYAYKYDGEDAYIFTGPLTNDAGWYGNVNGLYFQKNRLTNQTLSFSKNGYTYGWGSDNGFIGGITGDENPFALAFGCVYPSGGSPWSECSNVAYRRSTDFSDWSQVIPDSWLSANFGEVDQDSSRSEEILSLKYGPNNNIYAGIFGRWLLGPAEDTLKARPSFCISTDYGVTWGAPEIAPFGIIRSYVGQYGIEGDSCYIPFNSKNMVVMDNGDVFFATTLYEIADTNTKAYDEQLHQIIALHYSKDNSSWSINKIADISGYVCTYIDADEKSSTNQMDVEINLTRTIDGSKILCKWVDFVDAVDDEGNVVERFTTDVFVAGKDVANNQPWGQPLNVTNSLFLDRITWLPTYISNDLLNVPLLKVETFPDPADTSINMVNYTQRKNESVSQYVVFAQFDASKAVGVNDETISTNDFQINTIFPNPVQNIAELSFTTNRTGNLKLELFNSLGEKVQTILNNNFVQGIHSTEINVANLSSGVYYLSLTQNGQKVTKLINVIK